MSEAIDARFRRFAEHECTGRIGTPSPLYEHISLRLADDPDLHDLAECTRDEQPTPNLLFAAVQNLLFENPDEPLARWYPSVETDSESISEETYPAFRDFCRAYEPEIIDLVSTQRVQTNVVRRSACLVPAFERVSRLADRAPLGLVEIGPSAGLNLLWDHYRYDYGENNAIGNPESSVRIDCELRGDLEPPLPDRMPEIGTRYGIDLHPVDIRNEDEARWLRALIWPEHDDRRRLLDQAIEVAREHPPELIKGDILDTLESVVSDIPTEHTLCLFSAHVLHQLPVSERTALRELIARAGENRTVYWVTCEFGVDTGLPVMHLYRHENGVESGEFLAFYHGHGSWLHWLHHPS